MEKKLLFLVLFSVVFRLIFADEPIVFTNIYTIGGEPVIKQIVKTEISTEAQVNDAINEIIRNYKEHSKYSDTPLLAGVENILFDGELLSNKHPGIKQYFVPLTDYLTNILRSDLLKSNDAKKLVNKPKEFERYVIERLKDTMIVFPVLVVGKNNNSNEILLRKISDGKHYNLEELQLLLDRIKDDIDSAIPVVIHILLDHSGSMENTVTGVTRNLTNLLQEIWRYRASKSKPPLDEFLSDYFTDMPGGFYEIGESGYAFEVLHTVYLSAFKVMTDLVSQKLYDIYLKEKRLENPAKRLDFDYPQTNISYNDSRKFIEFLNNYYNTKGFFIPTEEQIEAFYKANPGKTPKIFEITGSFFGEYELVQKVDPNGPDTGTDMTVKGHYDDGGSSRFRPALRERIDPDTPSPLMGLRLAYRKQDDVK